MADTINTQRKDLNEILSHGGKVVFEENGVKYEISLDSNGNYVQREVSTETYDMDDKSDTKSKSDTSSKSGSGSTSAEERTVKFKYKKTGEKSSVELTEEEWEEYNKLKDNSEKSKYISNILKKRKYADLIDEFSKNKTGKTIPYTMEIDGKEYNFIINEQKQKELWEMYLKGDYKGVDKYLKNLAKDYDNFSNIASKFDKVDADGLPLTATDIEYPPGSGKTVHLTQRNQKYILQQLELGNTNNIYNCLQRLSEGVIYRITKRDSNGGILEYETNLYSFDGKCKTYTAPGGMGGTALESLSSDNRLEGWDIQISFYYKNGVPFPVANSTTANGMPITLYDGDTVLENDYTNIPGRLAWPWDGEPNHYTTEGGWATSGMGASDSQFAAANENGDGVLPNEPNSSSQ